VWATLHNCCSEEHNFPSSFNASCELRDYHPDQLNIHFTVMQIWTAVTGKRASVQIPLFKLSSDTFAAQMIHRKTTSVQSLYELRRFWCTIFHGVRSSKIVL
jgi:hypothetical protein